MCIRDSRIAAGRSRACLGPLRHAARRRALAQALGADSVVSLALAGSVSVQDCSQTGRPARSEFERASESEILGMPSVLQAASTAENLINRGKLLNS